MAAHARHYIYSPARTNTDVEEKYHRRDARVCIHTVHPRVRPGVHISPSLPFRGHKLSEHLSCQDAPETKQNGRAEAPLGSW